MVSRVSVCLLLLVLTSCTIGVKATPPLQPPSAVPKSCRTNNDDDRHQVPSQSTATTTSLFGVSQRLPSVLSMRGGAVEEPASLDDVKALLLKAGGEQKLVVIDFTGTFFFFCDCGFLREWVTLSLSLSDWLAVCFSLCVVRFDVLSQQRHGVDHVR